MRHSLAMLAFGLTLASCSGGSGTTGNTTPAQPNTTTPVLTSVTISASAQAAVVGSTLQLSVTPKDQNGSAINATVTWTSSAPAVASVSGTGLVTALAAGTTTITATATLGSTTAAAATLITVSAPPPVLVLSSVSVSATPSSIVIGATAQANASPKDQNGNVIAATVTWSSSAPTVASVNASTGLVTAQAVGTATLTASATAGSATVAGSTQVMVTAVPVTAVLSSVSVNPSAVTIFVGDALTLVAGPKDQNNTPIAATVTWSSSANTIVNVNAGTGAISGLSPGSATITASATAGGVTKTGIAQITVTVPPVLTSVVVSGGTSVAVGADLALSASPRDQNGSAITAAISWSSSNTGLATVNAVTGVVHGVLAGGPVTITASATAGGITRTGAQLVTVTGGFPLAANVVQSGFAFAPQSVDIAAGGTVSFSGLTGHTVTFNGGSPAQISGSDTGSATFGSAGSYPYHCSIHSFMTGTVIVH